MAFAADSASKAASLRGMSAGKVISTIRGLEVTALALHDATREEVTANNEMIVCILLLLLFVLLSLLSAVFYCRALPMISENTMLVLGQTETDRD